MEGRLLLVEDDDAIGEITAKGLTRVGFDVTRERDGRAGLARFAEDGFDLVILDIMLPLMDGFAVCRGIRSVSRAPVLMLTARADTEDVVLGLDAGADDYVTKPFEMPELVARVQALLRRVGDDDSHEVLRRGDVEIDIPAQKVVKRGQPLSLSSTEFKLLVTLARNPGRVMTREELLELVWHYDYLGDSKIVDVAIKRLRAKVEDDPTNPTLIQTVRGSGYRLEAS